MSTLDSFTRSGSADPKVASHPLLHALHSGFAFLVLPLLVALGAAYDAASADAFAATPDMTTGLIGLGIGAAVGYVIRPRKSAPCACQRTPRRSLLRRGR